MLLRWLAVKLKRKSKKLKAFVGYWLFIYPRTCKYRFLSTCPNVCGKPLVNQPLLLSGSSEISFGSNVDFLERTKAKIIASRSDIADGDKCLSALVAMCLRSIFIPKVQFVGASQRVISRSIAFVGVKFNDTKRY